MDCGWAEGEIVAGKYRVDRTLGQGGMGTVVAASHLSLPQRVAIKFLREDGNPELAARFLREARAAVRLKGEHVVRVLDVGELGAGTPYIVMEYLDGQDLAAVLRERGQLPVEDAVEYVLQACIGMAEAHSVGIVHRDLKPANLFLTTAPDGKRHVKVLDFGISKEIFLDSEEAASLTRTQQMLGSPVYMSPEQMRCSRSVDATADIWSLGANLYRFLVGYPPFNAVTLTELILKVTGSDPPRPSEMRPEIGPELERIILRCLDKDPARRFASVAELARALAPFAPPETGTAHAERAARILASAPAPRGGSRSSIPPPREVDTIDTGAGGARRLGSEAPVAVQAKPPRRASMSLSALAAGVVIGLVVAAVALSRRPPIAQRAPDAPATALEPAAAGRGAGDVVAPGPAAAGRGIDAAMPGSAAAGRAPDGGATAFPEGAAAQGGGPAASPQAARGPSSAPQASAAARRPPRAAASAPRPAASPDEEHDPFSIKLK